MKVILHIGLEKTGTTSIQRTCASKREELLRHGVLYPKTPGKSNHCAVAALAANPGKCLDLRTQLGIVDQSAFDAFLAEFPAKLQAEIRESGVDCVLLSNEHCSSRLGNPEELARLRASSWNSLPMRSRSWFISGVRTNSCSVPIPQRCELARRARWNCQTKMSSTIVTTTTGC